MCEYSGQCTARTSLWSYTATTGTYSAPLRPTSGASTSTVSATTTQPFVAPATASGSTLPITSTSSSNLSAGAIAGIVIGTIAGAILLLLLCFCCVVKGLWDVGLEVWGAVGAGLVGLAVVLGLKKREDDRREERDEKRRPGPTATVTDISSTYYTDSYTGTSASSASSDRRTRDDRRDRSSRR
ncbi:hypothetical protein DID88_001170 [Monilinia fructigena]|uniref:Uncharacterized protein n=1 Tax=Monilinia fructigena TaxID=38457 RepID=A0A395J052_9HELO|nr:hypothetical protein DID88_001170 [Monilinia fructigena]